MNYFSYLAFVFRKLTYVALHPLFQALLVAVAFILFFPLGLKKYRTELVDMSTHFDKMQILYADLDHDGVSEGILTFINDSGNAGIVINTNLGPDQQRNYRGVYEDKSPRLIIGDYDNDKTDEIFLFTQEHDSIFLHAIKFGKEPELFIQDRYIATLGKNLKNADYVIIPGKVTDMNGDSYGDLVFGINTGFSRSPRNVFIYNISSDSLSSSPKSGAFFNKLYMANLDDDPFEEIALFTSATDNFNEEAMEYHDSSSWLMVLDHDLSFLFPPVEYYGTTGNFITYPVHFPGRNPVLLCIHKGFKGGEQDNKAMIIDACGNILRAKKLEDKDKLMSIQLITHPIKGYSKDQVIGYCLNDGFYMLDTSLNFRKLSTIKFTNQGPGCLDIDMDGKDEFIIPRVDHKKHVIYRHDFSQPAEADFPFQSVTPVYSVKMSKGGPPLLSIQGDDQSWLFSYTINPIYRYRMFIYLGIYLAIFGFIFLIRRLYAIQLKKRYETEKKIAALQLSSIKSQMEPHFIFNVINSIGSSIYREKKDEAYQLVVRFSNMVRTLLSTSDQLYRTLQEELDFVTNFLELEKQRFPELFGYAVDVDNAIDRELLVPKMILQLHVENALKHGLRPKGLDGLLEISVSQSGDYLVLTIRDNGIGRKAAAELMSPSTGKGMKMLAQLFETYNKHNSKPILQEITDLADEQGQPAGTVVTVRVPLEFNPEIY